MLDAGTDLSLYSFLYYSYSRFVSVGTARGWYHFVPTSMLGDMRQKQRSLLDKTPGCSNASLPESAAENLTNKVYRY